MLHRSRPQAMQSPSALGPWRPVVPCEGAREPAQSFPAQTCSCLTSYMCTCLDEFVPRMEVLTELPPRLSWQ